ncbi:MAG: hypothetical protein QM652_01935 [Legionella sp.]|uniref:hypothetical protein n=1 Tax=Legionella sp. TaxID=459 RepID=UPI0039E6BF53
MNDGVRCFLIVLLSYASLTFAQPLVDDGRNFWQCTTHDTTGNKWVARSFYQKIALNFAFANCKKESTVPATCITASGNCEQFIQGVSIKPKWKCTALDFNAIAWEGNSYWQLYDAALAAKNYCRQKSKVPGTCYVNFVTCVNQNELNS